MKQPKPAVTCETRYRHKLNMLEPGTAMLKWVGIFLLLGLVLRLLHRTLASWIAFGFAGAIFLMLMILLIVEAHQDHVLNELAARENRK